MSALLPMGWAFAGAAWCGAAVEASQRAARALLGSASRLPMEVVAKVSVVAVPLSAPRSCIPV